MPTDQGVEVYGRVLGGRRRYRATGGELRDAPAGKLATVKEDTDGCLEVVDTGPLMVDETEEPDSTFFQHLRSYGEEWFWDDLRTPDGIEWIPEAMSKGTLMSVTDGSYIKQLAPNFCGAGWIVQNKLTGKKVKGSLAEWSSFVGRYRGEMLGMLAVEYFQQHGKVGEGNRVSCDNKGALTTFDKKEKKIPAASSNADVRRGLRELDRRALASYKLEHVKGHQTRNKKLKSLTLEARLNIKCDEIAKQTVRASVKSRIGPSSQTMPLEKCSVFVGGGKQASDPKEAIKQMVGREAAREYYASTSAQKGGMRREAVDTVAWGGKRGGA